VFTQVIGLAHRAAEAYAAFGTEIMNIRDLTGSSAQESTRAASLFGLAGVTDVQEIREILRLEQSVFSQQGRAALGRIGVSANPNVTGLTLFNQVAEALQRYPDGILKAQAMTDIFGQKSVQALLPLLRLTKEQRDRAFELADTFDTRMLPVIQQWQYMSANLGQTLEMRVIFPIAQRLLPVFIKLADVIVYLADRFAALDKVMGGALSYLLAFSGAAVGVWALVTAGLALVSVLKQMALWQAIVAALSGNWKNLAIAVGIGAAAGVAIWGADKLMGNGGSSSAAGPVDKFGKAVDQFDASVNRMQEGWQRLNRGGIPSGLDEIGLDAISRQMMLPALG
jgi:hypothetical protein